MPYTTLEYPAEPYSSLNRFSTRGSHELETIHRILNASPLLHVSFNTDSSPFPMILPMIGFVGSFSRPSTDLGGVLDLYLHGHVSSRLMRIARGTKNGHSGHENTVQDETAAGLPVSIAASFVDGLVLTTTPNGHVYNYRSAIVFGHASPVTDDEEKLWAMRKTTEKVVPGQWDHLVLPLAKTELASVSVLCVKIKTGSAKIRTGPPSPTPDETGKDDNDAFIDGINGLKTRTRNHKDVWKGVLPVYQTIGDPIATPDRREMPTPGHIVDYRRCFNDASKAYAMDAATTTMGTKKKH